MGLLSNYLVLGVVVVCSTALPHTAKLSGSHGGAMSTGAEYVSPAGGQEPSCEELRAMWRFSKRQSRATDITNEIPTYRDPFAYNMWIPYARPRSIVGGLGQRRKGIVYGKAVFEAPRSRSREELARHFNAAVPQGSSLPSRKGQTAFRLSGGGVTSVQPSQTGSFQHLQKLIRADRARELQQQRMAEEEAARHAALKEVGAPTYFGRMIQDPRHPASPEFMYGDVGARVMGLPARNKFADEEYLSPHLTEHIYNQRSLPESLARSTDLERGFYQH